MLGETRKMNNGMKCTIINWLNAHNIDVRFENGAIVKRKSYGEFVRGTIKKPGEEDRRMIGRSKIMLNGIKCTIIKWRNSEDIDVRFEDGTVIEHTTNFKFQYGLIKHPLKEKIHKTYKKEDMIGESLILNCGMRGVIKEWRKACDIDVELEDGIIVEHKTYDAFSKGCINHPSFSKGYKSSDYHHQKVRLAGISGTEAEGGRGLFECTCNICGEWNLFTVPLILQHEKEHIEKGEC